MVIQRWQTVMLILAVCLMAAFCSSGYGISINEDCLADSAPLLVRDAPLYLIGNLVIAVILFVTIFLFKNLKRQMGVTLLSIILICVSAALCVWMVYGGLSGSHVEWTGGIFLLLGALVCTIMAYNFMRKDKKLLSSYDRLR